MYTDSQPPFTHVWSVIYAKKDIKHAIKVKGEFDMNYFFFKYSIDIVTLLVL